MTKCVSLFYNPKETLTDKKYQQLQQGQSVVVFVCEQCTHQSVYLESQ